MLTEVAERQGGDAARPLVEQFLQRAAAHPNKLAMRWKARGIWHEQTWAGYRERVERLSSGLHRIGVGEGSTVLILGRPSPAWLHIDLAAQCLGALPAPVHATTTIDQLRAILTELAPTTVVATRPEDLARFRAAEPAASSVRHVVVALGTSRSSATDDDRLVSMDRLVEVDPADASDDEARRAVLLTRSADTPAVLALSVGTTGPARAVALSSANLLSGWSVLGSLPAPPTGHDRVLSSMCLGLLAERALAQILPIVSGCVVHFPESELLLAEARREVRPTICAAVPEVWETEAKVVEEHLDGVPRLRRLLYRTAERSPGRGFAHTRLLRRIGHDRTRIALVVGGPLAPAVETSWRRWGLVVHEVYGSVETSGIAGLYSGSGAARRLVRCPAGTTVSTSADGELRVVGPNVPAHVIDVGAALRTGDVGIDAGSAGCAGPLARRLYLADGSAVDPMPIEAELRSSRAIARAIVVGDASAALAAVLEPNLRTLSAWASRHGVLFSSTHELLSDSAVTERIGSAVAAVNVRREAAGLAPIATYRVIEDSLVAGVDVTASGSIRTADRTGQLDALIEEMLVDTGRPLAHSPAGQGISSR